MVREPAPSPPVATARPAPPAPPSGRGWIGPVAGLAAGLVLGLVLATLWQDRIVAGHGAVVLPVVGILAAGWVLLRRRAKAGKPLGAVVARLTGQPQSPVPDTDLDRGVRDVRRTDPGFDAARFAGYAAMTFRDLQSAGMARDAGILRARLTPAMNAELQASGDRLRALGRSVRIAEVDVTSEVTEAWQDGERDYVTAYVAGSLRRHTVDDATGRVVDGSAAQPVPVVAFLTFTRPAGLNFWMLSFVQEE